MRYPACHVYILWLGGISIDLSCVDMRVHVAQGSVAKLGWNS